MTNTTQPPSMPQAHALLIGVGSYTNHPRMNVAVTARDAQALAAVLRDPRFCGYPEAQVQLLSNGTATRDGVLSALDGLASLSEASTVFLFYAGHGEYGTDGNYALTTYDTKLEGGKVVTGTGVSEQELLERLRNVKAKRVLTVFNACHAGELSPTLGADADPPTGVPFAEKTAAALLATGTGRVIITACREQQVSYIGGGSLTLFGQALVDGLQGKGDYISNRSGFISAYDLYSHLYDTLQQWVPQRIAAELRLKHGAAQEPELTVLKGVGPFAVALYRGATTLGSFQAPERPELDAGLHEVDEARSQRLLSRILPQVQAGRDVTTAGRDNLAGAHIEGGFTGGNRSERRGVIDFGSGGQFGNLNFGDIAGGNITKDSITVGTVSGSSGIVIGRDLQAQVTTGGSAEQLAAAFGTVYAKITASPESVAVKAVVTEQVKQVEAEAAKGAAANASTIEGWLTVIARMMPDILEVTANILLSPLAGVTSIVKKVAEQAKATKR